VLLTSANLAGGAEARTMAEVPAEIRAGVDLALDRGQLPGTPSTVVDLGALETDGRWRLVRAGAVAASIVELALVGSWS
jgi:L-threonylcarbamoyladenylate synthase